jgi:hypothetical protein
MMVERWECTVAVYSETVVVSFFWKLGFRVLLGFLHDWCLWPDLVKIYRNCGCFVVYG